MQQLTYVKPGGSQSNESDCIKLRCGEPFILSSINGVSGLVRSTVSNQIVGVDGKDMQSVYCEPREISCTVYVQGIDRTDMYKNRMELIGKLSAGKECGTVVYSNDYITVQIAAIPILPAEFSERIKNYNKCDIKFYCPYPFWSDTQQHSVQTAYEVTDDSFSFPLKFEDTISFADNKTSVVIDYKGSAATPVWITLIGSLYSPTITNETTGESISINDVDMGASDSLSICTKRGAKSVTFVKDGVATDAFNLISPMSTFWELVPGENVISYTSYKGISAASLIVSYCNLYTGV